MASLNGRDAIEARVARTLGTEFGALADRVEEWLIRRGITDGVRVRMPLSEWENLTESLRLGIRFDLEYVYLESAELFQDQINFSMTKEELEQAAFAWADDRSEMLVRQMNQTSADRLATVVDEYFDTEMTLSELRQRLRGYVFSSSRVSAASVTEITRASASAQEDFANRLRNEGIDIRTVWQANNDEMVCPVCGPRHGMAQGTNWFDLPPAHVGCRCFTTHEILYLEDDSS